MKDSEKRRIWLICTCITAISVTVSVDEDVQYLLEAFALKLRYDYGYPQQMELYDHGNRIEKYVKVRDLPKTADDDMTPLIVKVRPLIYLICEDVASHVKESFDIYSKRLLPYFTSSPESTHSSSMWIAKRQTVNTMKKVN